MVRVKGRFLAATGCDADFVVSQFERRLESISMTGSENRDRLRRVESRDTFLSVKKRPTADDSRR